MYPFWYRDSVSLTVTSLGQELPQSAIQPIVQRIYVILSELVC